MKEKRMKLYDPPAFEFSQDGLVSMNIKSIVKRAEKTGSLRRLQKGWDV